MDERILRQAFKEQFHAALAMLADCVERCPDDLWTVGAHPRPFWRVAFHAVFFAQLYLGQNLEAFRPWPGHREDVGALLRDGTTVEPYELPEETEPYTRREVLDYVAHVDLLVDPTVDALDLSAPATGFDWYRDMTKLSHELLNLRHVQGHVGQLSELLMAHGIDSDWISRVKPASSLQK